MLMTNGKGADGHAQADRGGAAAGFTGGGIDTVVAAGHPSLLERAKLEDLEAVCDSYDWRLIA